MPYFCYVKSLYLTQRFWQFVMDDGWWSSWNRCRWHVFLHVRRDSLIHAILNSNHDWLQIEIQPCETDWLQIQQSILACGSQAFIATLLFDPLPSPWSVDHLMVMMLLLLLQKCDRGIFDWMKWIPRPRVACLRLKLDYVLWFQDWLLLLMLCASHHW